MVARGTNRSSVFGAFYDSTLDRVADGFVLGGLAVYFASWQSRVGTAMVVVCLLGLIGTFVTSYTRARAEALGVDAKVGLLQRPERVVLLSAPQAFFGLTLGGLVLIAIIVLLTVTAWITAAQRILAVYRAVGGRSASVQTAHAASEAPAAGMLGDAAPPRSIVKGE
jgi:phosphatidylglycerophosphate synthase